MAITFNTAFNTGTGSAPTITHGLTINDGDLVVAQVWLNGVYTLSTLDGFTVDYSPTATSASTHILSKVAGASEPSSYTLGFASSQRWVFQITVISGADTSAPYDVAPQAATVSLGGTSTVTIPAITTVTDGALAIMSIGHDVSSIASQTIDTAGWTELINHLGGQPLASAGKIIATAGTTGGVDVTRAGTPTGQAWGFAIKPATSGLTIDSTDATMQRSTDFQVVCSTPTTAPTTGNTTLSVGGDTLTPSSVTGSDPYTITFPVGDLTKQVDAVGYDWTLTVDLETATTGNIPLAIQAGYTKVDLVSPDTTDASLLYGLTGDAPITGDDLEYDVTSVLDSGVSLSGVSASGVWTVTEAVSGDWVTDITVSRRVVQANGTIGTEAVMTLSAPTSTSGLTIVTDMVSNIVSNMVN